MKTTFLKSAFVFLCMAFFTVVNAQSGDDLLGVWLVGDKDAKVEIYKCGSAYCAKIVWLESPKDEKGNPRTDVNNPSEAKQSRKLMGMTFMTGFKWDADDKEWSDGELYQSSTGKTYSGYMEMQKDGTLYMKGYIMGMRFLGKSNVWTRSSI